MTALFSEFPGLRPRPCHRAGSRRSNGAEWAAFTPEARTPCARVFHDEGHPIGDFRKRWATACRAEGLASRKVHDLRRSGVKHLIDSGVDPHTVMAFSGHRTVSMLRRYHIIDLDDLRRAAERAQAYSGTRANVTPLRPDAGTAIQQPHMAGQEAEPAPRS